MSLATAAVLASVGLVSGPAVGAATPHAAVAAKKKAGKVLKGTIRCSETNTRVDDQPGGDRIESEIIRGGTVTVNIKAGPRNSFNTEATGKGSYSQTVQGVTQERDFDGRVNCTITKAGEASGGGSFGKGGLTAYATLINKSGSSFGEGTKGVALDAFIPYSGSRTNTYVGSGLSPCVDFTEPYDITSQEFGSGAGPGSGAWVCLPNGLSKGLVTRQAGQLVGKRKGNSFRFSCQGSWPSGQTGGTVTIKVSGKLQVT